MARNSCRKIFFPEKRADYYYYYSVDDCGFRGGKGVEVVLLVYGFNAVCSCR